MNRDARRIELDDVAVKAPCPMTWAELEGDEERRFCQECSLHVVNLSAMTRSSAQALLDENAGDDRLCVTFTRRTDGSVVTAGPTAARGRWRGFVRMAAALLFGFFPLLAGCRPGAKDDDPSVSGIDPPPDKGVDPTCTTLVGEVAYPENEESHQISVPETVLGRLAPPAPPPAD